MGLEGSWVGILLLDTVHGSLTLDQFSQTHERAHRPPELKDQTTGWLCPHAFPGGMTDDVKAWSLCIFCKWIEVTSGGWQTGAPWLVLITLLQALGEHPTLLSPLLHPHHDWPPLSKVAPRNLYSFKITLLRYKWQWTIHICNVPFEKFGTYASTKEPLPQRTQWTRHHP